MELTGRATPEARCEHPARRVYAWVARDEYGAPVLCAGCCACGEVLAGAAERSEHSQHPLAPSNPPERQGHQ